MAILPKSLDYSARDFLALRLRLQGLIRSVFPDWTDFDSKTFGNILLELFAHVGDILNYYQDSQAAEAFWTTLQQRVSAIKLGQLINFTLSGASAATAGELFSLSSPATKRVILQKGLRLRTSDPTTPLPFQLLTAATIEVGQQQPTSGGQPALLQIEQSESRSETFISTEEPKQELTLRYTPFLDGSLGTPGGLDATGQVVADDGPYTIVDTFLGYKATDRVFIVDVDQYDRAYVRFGDGVTGAIPHGDVLVNYKIGGGVAGNVDANHITIIEDAIFYEDSQPAPVSATNPQAATGGTDRMTLEQARVLAPASLRVLTRTVTKEDFETVAKSVRGVARALMATSNEYAGIDENTGRLYIVAQGAKLASGRIASATASQSLLDAVKAEILNNKPPTITFSFEVYAIGAPATPFTNVQISTRIYLEQGADSSIVGAAIRANLEDFFAAQLPEGLDNPDIDFGANLKDATGAISGEIVWSDIFHAILNTTGVRKVDEGTQGLLINTGTGYLRKSVQLLPIGFPRLSSVDITDVDTGEAL